jgi:hypothetical protein
MSKATGISWLGNTNQLVLDSNTATIAGVTVNVIPVSYQNASSTAVALPTSGTAAYTSSAILAPGTYLVTAEVYTYKPTAGWIANDYISWDVQATSGSSDVVGSSCQPFYYTGNTLGTVTQNIVGQSVFSVASTLDVRVVYSITNSGALCLVNGVTWQKVA